jgi:putative CocE/NonD family hydrolase
MGLQLRGTGCSSGTFNLFDRKWGTDGAHGVEWAAKQPWSTGRVGMFLWSWPGITQLFVAAQRPPHLDAIAPGMVVTDALRDVGAPGGLGNASFPTLWWATIQDAWTFAASSAPAEGDSKCLTNLAVNLANGQLRSPTTLSTHLFWDRFWADRDLLAMTKRIKVPVLSMVDWQDEEVGARAGYYWGNLNPRKTWVVGTNGQHDIYLSNAFARTLRAFFDHFLKGRSNGFARTPHVRLWQDTTAPGGPQSSDEQLAHAEPAYVVTQRRLPIQVRANRLFLTASGRLSATRPKSATGARSFVAAPGPVVNFDVPAAVTGGDGGQLGEAPWQLSTPNAGALTFTTSRLSKSVVIAGPASVDLWVTSALPVGALQATLTDVRRDGQETYLQRGWLDLTQRAIDKRRSTALAPFHPQTLATLAPMIPGRPTLVRIEIPNVSHVFPKGSAIRVTIDAPSPTGDWIFDAVPAGLHVIGTSRVQASSLILGVMRTGVRTGKLPNCARLTGTPCRPNSAPVPAGAPTVLSAPPRGGIRTR